MKLAGLAVRSDLSAGLAVRKVAGEVKEGSYIATWLGIMWSILLLNTCNFVLYILHRQFKSACWHYVRC